MPRCGPLVFLQPRARRAKRSGPEFRGSPGRTLFTVGRTTRKRLTMVLGAAGGARRKRSVVLGDERADRVIELRRNLFMTASPEHCQWGYSG
eukprot:10861290-Heterocapsa_arctica.AAC.1